MIVPAVWSAILIVQRDDFKEIVIYITHKFYVNNGLKIFKVNVVNFLEV